MTLPPLHPILVNFTAALVPASLASDLLGRWLRRQSLTSAGWWMLLYAAVVTPFTALAGWPWLREMGGTDVPEMMIHKWLGTTLAVLFLVQVVWRWRIHHTDGVPGWPYLICAMVVVAALVFQGHLGGMMSFGNEAATTQDQSGSPHNHPSEHKEKPDLQWRDHIDLKDK